MAEYVVDQLVISKGQDTYILDTAGSLEPIIEAKADKVDGATNGNFAGLDTNGNLVDSGHKHSDYLTEHQDISGKADKSATVSTVSYDSTNKKLTKTINGTTSDVVTVATLKTALSLAKGDVGLENVENKSSATIRGEINSNNVTTALGFTPMNVNLKGANNGVAELDSAGKVPSSQLPSFVDDVLEYDKQSSFPTTGETGKIYIAKDTNKTYRWSGTAYVEISASLALGETSSTAYRGDRGKTAYDHASAKGSAFSEGLYKITTNSQGHVTAATAVAKSDITALGIPGSDTNTHRPIRVNGTQILGNNTTDLNLKAGSNVSVTNSSGTVTIAATDTTYSDATTSTHGLMSAEDKTKLDGVATGATANVGTITGIKMNGSSKGTSGVVDLGTVITAHQDISGKVSGPSSATNNAVAIFDGTGGKTIKNSGFTIGKSVPSDAVFTDHLYDAGVGLSKSGGTFAVKLGYESVGKNYRVQADGSGDLYVVVPWENTTYSAATTSVNGLMSASDKTKLDSLSDQIANFIPNNGSDGQLLKSNGDGTAEWSNVGTPSDAQVGTAVSAWLTDHPEATTTVQDGAISRAKLDADLKEKTDEVPNLKSAFNGFGVINYDGSIDYESDNLLLIVDITEGKYLNANGSIGTSSEFGYTDYINIYNKEKLTFSGNGGNNLFIWYDINKQKMNSNTINNVIGNSPSVSIPSDAYYCRFNVVLANLSGNTFKVYRKINTVGIEQVRSLSEKLENLVQTDGGTVIISSGDELAGNEITEGKYLNANGSEGTNAEFGYTDYIDIKDKNYLEFNGNGGSNLLLWYNEDKELKGSNTISNVTGKTPSVEIPSIAAYCRFNVVLANLSANTFKVYREKNTIAKQQVRGLQETNIVLGTDYTNLIDAVNAAKAVASENNVVNIIIPEGEYNAFAGIDLSAQTSSFVGIVLPDYTNIIGVGYNNKIIIKAELPSDMTGYAFQRDNVSTLNLWKNNNVKNVTVKSKNMRYSIHNDDYVTNAVDDAEELFENLILISELGEGITGASAIPMGIGAINGRKTTIKKCKFINIANTFSSLIVHNNLNSNNACSWEIEECLFSGGSYSLHILSYGSDDDFDTISLIGCKLEKKIRFQSGDNATTKSQIVLYGNGNALSGFAYVGITENTGEKDMLIN